MASSATKLKHAKALRQLQIDHIEELVILAQSAVMDESVHVRFKLRCECLDEIYDEFQKQHDAIILLLSTAEIPDFEPEKATRTTFFDNYYTVRTIFTNLFSGAKSNITENNSNKSPNVKLPKIALPIFDGTYRNWPSFYDLFSTLIHNNNALSDIEKFQYLLSSLTSHALTLIKSIPITTQNYATAFKTLTDRYQNRRLLANSCWQAIFNASKLTSESANGLRQLLEVFNENLAALTNLQLPVDQWDFILFHILLQKLDASTVKRFELQEASTEIPSFSTLQNFLLKQCTALESVALSIPFQKATKNMPPQSSTLNRNSHSSYSTPVKASSSFFVHSNLPPKVYTCNYCKSSHSIYKCSVFQNKTPSDRLQIAKENHWCTNCLHGGHRINSCSSQSSCRICHGKHHTLLHISRNSSAPSSDNVRQNSDDVSSSVATAVATTPSSHTSVAQVHSLSNFIPSKAVVLLATARIEILDAWGKYQSIRVLIDGGSQANVISQQCTQRLGLKTSHMSLSIFGLGQTSSSTSRGVVCTIRPIGHTNPSFTIDAVVLPKICTDMPNHVISCENWKHISNIKLADPQFNIPGPIDMLLGADIFPLILQDGKLSGNSNEPIAINTVFGWILMGKVSCVPLTQSFVNSFFVATEPSLDSILRRFWEIEEIPQVKSFSPEDIRCENSFMNTYYRDYTGRYSVALPFKDLEPSFGDSRSSALRRLYSLERRLLRDSSLHSSYCDFMKDYLDSGHMELLTSPLSNDGKVFYIPHHCVTNLNSSTTRIRVVFDASAKAADGCSLNDTLLIGPKLQKDVVTLLLHFRCHQLVFTSDIKQMYRQINLHSRHRDYQRILWRFSPQDPVQEFRLNTVTYGISSAPFLALRTLQQLATDECKSFPLASNVIRSDIYVDDIVTGCSDLNEALMIKDQIISLLNTGGFLLRKWASNSSSFLATVPENLRQTQSLCFSDEENSIVKILGLTWLPSSDVFSYSIETFNRPCTKRTLLSEVARIFDPLGFLSPITFFLKYLIQYLWTLGLEWDQTPPSEVLDRWNRYKYDLSSLEHLKIPRCCIPENFTNCQLHGFCDSSEKGYAAVIYFRFQLPDNKICISLICAKSKVSPLKRISLPRLELCAAVLLSKLISFVVVTYSDKITLENIFAWSDSMHYLDSIILD